MMRQPVVPMEVIASRELLTDLAVLARSDAELADEVRRVLTGDLGPFEAWRTWLGFQLAGYLARRRSVRFEGEAILRELVGRRKRRRAGATT